MKKSKVVADWLTDVIGRGLEPHEISVFVRSTDQLDRATTAVANAGLQFTVLDDRVQTTEGRLRQYHALGEGIGVPRRRCHGLRR